MVCFVSLESNQSNILYAYSISTVKMQNLFYEMFSINKQNNNIKSSYVQEPGTQRTIRYAHVEGYA